VGGARCTHRRKPSDDEWRIWVRSGLDRNAAALSIEGSDSFSEDGGSARHRSGAFTFREFWTALADPK
jgi:hypothetical protein